MKTKLTTKTLIISAAVLLVGAAVAFAGGGYWGGPGGHMMGYGAGYGMGPGMMGYGYGPGSGYGMGPGMMGYGPGYGYGMGPGMMYGYGGAGAGYWGNLTPDQRAKLDASQQKFYTETQGLREQIQDKRYALQSEFAKAAPDEGKITNLQKELSKLEGEFDQKAVQHQLEVRKLLPEDARGGFGPGYGGGYCWR